MKRCENENNKHFVLDHNEASRAQQKIDWNQLNAHKWNNVDFRFPDARKENQKKIEMKRFSWHRKSNAEKTQFLIFQFNIFFSFQLRYRTLSFSVIQPSTNDFLILIEKLFSNKNEWIKFNVIYVDTHSFWSTNDDTKS